MSRLAVTALCVAAAVAAAVVAQAAAAEPAPGPLVPSLTDLIETADLSTPTLSPDGRLVAVREGRASLGGNRYELGWWVVATDGKTPARKIADGGTALWSASGVAEPEAPRWSADSRWIYFRVARDGEVQVWRAAADGSGAEQVTHDDADVQGFTLEAGGRLAYVVRATRQEIVDERRRLQDGGVRIDDRVDPAQNLFGGVEVNGRVGEQRFSGPWFQRMGLLGDRPERRKAIDLATLRAVAPVAGEGPPPTPERTGWGAYPATGPLSPAGLGRVIITTPGRSGRLEVDRADGAKVTCQAELCASGRLVWAAWRGDLDEVVFATSDLARRNAVYRWRVGETTVRQVTSAVRQQDGGGFDDPCAVSVNAMICVTADPLTPERLERISLDTGRGLPLFAPTPRPAPSDLQLETLAWRDAQGRRFSGQLLRPRNASGRLPLFLSYYDCGGYLRGGTGDQWPFAIMAQAGIAAMCINRTSDLTPHDPAHPDILEDYEAGLAGVSAAIDLLDARGVIDRKRVGMGGLSFGSEATLWVGRQSDLLAAMSIASVELEPAYYWINGMKGRDIHDGLQRAWKLGSPEETPERWKLISPALNVGQIKTPLLMQMPEQEFRPTIEFIARMSNSPTPFDIYAFANEPHILTQPRHRLAAYARNVDWFRFWLQGYEDPAPAKAEQYRLWRAMKAKSAS